MDFTSILVGLIVGGIAAATAVYFLSRKNTVQNLEPVLEPILSKAIESKIREVFPETLKSANEQLVLMANEKLGAEKKEIRADVESKRDELQRLVKAIQDELKETQKKTEESDKQRVGSFMALKSSLDDHKKLTEQLAVSTETLKKILSNNQLRGQFGERIAEDLLKMAGFVSGVDYFANKKLSESETRPDFSVNFPDGTKINVDSKFPYSNLQKMAEAESEDAKKEYRNLFEKDVRDKIKQVCTRNYINPDENTVDFVILFIPNEMIFSYIYDKMSDVWLEAMEKKVVLAGPFSFTAILRMVRQAHENFRYQKNVRQMIVNIQKFEEEFGKYNEEFEKIGERIRSLDKQYSLVSETRTKQLVKTVEKVRLENAGDPEVKILNLNSPDSNIDIEQ